MRTGFTLAEIIVVLSILLIIAGTTSPAYPRLLAPILLDSTELEIVQLIRLARASAEAGERNASFGIYVQPTRITMFQGTSYASRNAIYDRPLDMHSSITLSGATETIFVQKTGLPSANRTISITHVTGAQRHLFINTQGVIERVAEGTIPINSSEDTYLVQNTPSTAYGGASDVHEYPWNSGYNQRGLVRFNLSNIPASASVTNAILSLQETGTYGSTRTVGVYRVTSAWTEAGATWVSRDGISGWVTSGGDFVQSPTATQTLSWDGSLDWASWNVTADVQNIVAGLIVNNGWLIKDVNEDASQAYWFFSSREGTSTPTLTVTYAL